MVDAVYARSFQVWEFQTPAVLNQGAPVQDTWYPLLSATFRVRIMDINVNIEDTNEDLELRVTIDGQTISGSFTATHSTTYHSYKQNNAITRVAEWAFANSARNHSFLIEGSSVAVDLRKTTANGVGNLTGIVTYGVLRRA